MSKKLGLVVLVMGSLLLTPTFLMGAEGSQTSGWGSAQLIETDNSGDASYPQVAIDPSGNTIAVWRQSDGTRYNIWANRFTAGTGWGTAQLIETENSGDALFPQVAVDPSGNAIAVWHQSDGTRYNIWANRYTSGTGWGTALLIETDNSGYAYDPQAAIDPSGNAIAVWYQSDGTRFNIWANRYTTGTGWGTAQLIETDNSGHAMYPQVAIDPSGNAIAVWRQSDGTRYNIWANRYTAGTGWGTAQLLETDNSGEALGPQVAIDPSGNAIAVWYQYDGSRNNIWENRYTSGTGWGTAQLIETDNSGHASNPQVAIDPSGNAIAAWHQSDGTRYNIWTNRYTSGTGWGTARLIETDNSGHAMYPQVAIDPSGNAIAVWYQHDGTRYNIWANRYTSGSGWGTAQLIETDNSNSAYDPQVAIDPSGNAIAVWYQHDGTRYNIWANRYTSGSGWGTAQLIETDNSGHAMYPQVAIDPSGNATAVWEQYDGTSLNIYANRYTAGTGWGTAQLIETNYSGPAYSPQVAVDPSGNAIVVWYQHDGTSFNIHANRYTAGTGWGTAQLIETDNSGTASFPQIAVDPSGNAIAVWRQSDGTQDNIWANRYIMPDTTPPPLHISSPGNGMETDINTVVVNGMTEHGASVGINGIAAYVENNGSFSVMIPLKRGENTITVKASDPSGNINTASLNVIYSDPLLSELSSLQTSLSSLNDQLGAVTTQVSSLEGAISELEDMLDSLEESINEMNSSYFDNISYLKEEMESLKVELDRTQQNMTMLNDTLAGLGDVDLSGIETSIDSLENDLKGLQTDVGDMEANVERLESDISSLGSEVDDLKGAEEGGLEDDVKDLKKAVNVLWVVLIVMTVVIVFLFLILIIMMGIVMMGKRKKDRIEE